jgi:hypothetical protein
MTTTRVLTDTDLVEETEDLSTSLLASGFFVVHDTRGGGEYDVSELTRGQEVVDPGFDVLELDVEAGRDDTALVQATDELDDNFSGAMVVDDFEFTNVT